MSANSLSSRTYRDKYKAASLQEVLRNALVAEKICDVDRTDNFRIQNPYASQPTATISAITGTYTVGTWSTTDDTLTITEEIKVPEHVYDFENILNNFDIFAERIDVANYAVAYAIDTYCLNALATDGTGTYSTPSGGFTTASNINTIMANLVAKVAGYAETYRGLFLVIENTDLVGFVQAQATNGYSFADAALNNGWMTQYLGVDIYVVRSGTFQTTTLGTKSVTGSGKRIFGVKGVATYASPRGIRFDEKAVSGKTGMELITWGYLGFKLWTQKAGLVVVITLTA